ncbi:MAG: hypothetical protein ACR2FG_01135 [Marmoricola sp.]
MVPVLAAVLLLAVSGCGTKDPAADPTPTTSDTASDTASDTVSDNPTASETPTPTSTSTSTATTPGAPTAAPKPAALLLPAGELPGFDPTWDWSVRSTGAQRGPLGVCQRFPMQTIGADKTLVRSFVPTGDQIGGTGAHLVSTFVDDKSASQAIAILQTFHDRCGERLMALRHTTVGPVTTVPTAKGTATRYLVTYTEKGASKPTFDDLGVLRSGSTVELVQLKLRGQTFPKPDPMTKALQNAAARLP